MRSGQAYGEVAQPDAAGRVPGARVPVPEELDSACDCRCSRRQEPSMLRLSQKPMTRPCSFSPLPLPNLTAVTVGGCRSPVAVAAVATACGSALSVGGAGLGGPAGMGMEGPGSQRATRRADISANVGRSWGSLCKHLSASCLYSGGVGSGKRGKRLLGTSRPRSHRYGFSPVYKHHISTPYEYTSDPVVTCMAQAGQAQQAERGQSDRQGCLGTSIINV